MAGRRSQKKNQLYFQKIFLVIFIAIVFVFIFLWELNFFAGIPAGFPKDLIRERRIKIIDSLEKNNALAVSYKSKLGASDALERYESYFAKKEYQNMQDFNSQFTVQNTFFYAKYFTDGKDLIFLKIIKDNSSKTIITIRFGSKPENGLVLLPSGFPEESLPPGYFLISAEESSPQKGSPTFSLSTKVSKDIFEVRDFYIDFFKKNGWERELIQEEKSSDPLTGVSEKIQYIWIRATRGENVFVVNINRIDDNNSLVGVLYGL